MRTRSLLVTFFTLLLLAAAVPVMAHEGHTHSASGTVRSIETGQLQIDTANGEQLIFMVDDQTAFHRGDDDADRAAIQTGERVVVRYEMRDGHQHALEVKLSPRSSASDRTADDPAAW